MKNFFDFKIKLLKDPLVSLPLKKLILTQLNMKGIDELKQESKLESKLLRIYSDKVKTVNECFTKLEQKNVNNNPAQFFTNKATSTINSNSFLSFTQPK